MYSIDWINVVTSKYFFLMPWGMAAILLVFHFMDNYELKMQIQPKEKKK